jgi:hypothetical protein
MLRSVFKYLYGGEAIAFRSSLSIEEGIERLRALTNRSRPGPQREGRPVGKVKHEDVRLQWSQAKFTWNFKPVFVGRFYQKDGHALLKSEIRLSRWAGFFSAFFYGLAVIWFLKAVDMVFRSYLSAGPGEFNWANVIVPFYGVVPFLVGLSPAFVGRAGYEQDKAQLIVTIERAIGDNET